MAWITILRKRDGFRAAFDGFDPRIIAGYGEEDVQRLLADAGIVRHRGKIEATIGNARAWVEIEGEPGGFSQFLWSFVGGATLQPTRDHTDHLSMEVAVERLLADLRERGKLTGERPADRQLAILLIDEYVRFPKS